MLAILKGEPRETVLGLAVLLLVKLGSLALLISFLDIFPREARAKFFLLLLPLFLCSKL